MGVGTRAAGLTAVAATALAAAGCAGGGASGERPPDPSGRPSSPAPDGSAAAQAPAGQGPFVYNPHGEGEPAPEREPADLVASEFTTVNDLDWTEWGDERARGEGALSGTWCLPGCEEDPYPATIELSDPQSVGGTLYFTSFRVLGADGLPDDERRRMEEADSGMLPHP